MSSDISSHGILSPDSGILSPGSSIPSPDSGILSPGSSIPSPANTLSYGKAKKPKKDSETFYKDFEGRGIVYLPRYINGLSKKLHLLAAEFFADNTTIRNELVHEFDALL